MEKKSVLREKKSIVERFSGMALHALIAFALAAALGACSSAPSSRTYVREDADFSRVQRVAVFPFESLTKDDFAGERVRRLVISELLARGVDVIEPGEVGNALRPILSQKTLVAFSKDDLKKTAKALGADVILMGSVEAYQMTSGLTTSYPEVSVTFRLVDAASADIMWSISHTSGGASFWTRHFGAEGRTLSEAARAVVKEAIARMP